MYALHCIICFIYIYSLALFALALYGNELFPFLGMFSLLWWSLSVFSSWSNWKFF